MSNSSLSPTNLFSSTTDPSTPTLKTGDIYYNSTNQRLRFYSGTVWGDVSPVYSVASKTGAVTLTAADITAGTFPAGAFSFVGVVNTSSGDTSGGAYIGAATTGSEMKLGGSGSHHWAFRNAAGTLNIGTSDAATTIGQTLTSILSLATTGATVTGTLNSTGNLSENGNRVYSSANANLATTVAAETTWGVASAVGTGTLFARNDHTHGTPATPVTSAVAGAGIGVSAATGAVTISNTGATSVAGRTGAVTLTAADIAAGSYPSGNFTYSGNLTVTGVSQLGLRSLIGAEFTATTGAGDATQFLSITSTNLAMNVEIELACVMGTTVITRTFDIATTSTIGTAATWYVSLPVDASQNQATGTIWDFQLEVNRTSATNMVFRIHNQNATANVAPTAAAKYSYTATIVSESAGWTYSQATSTTVGAAVVTAIHPSNQLFTGPTQVGIGTQSPSATFTVAGGITATGTLNAQTQVQENGVRVYSSNNAPPYPVTSVATRTGAITLTAADIGAGTFGSGSFVFTGGTVTAPAVNAPNRRQSDKFMSMGA